MWMRVISAARRHWTLIGWALTAAALLTALHLRTGQRNDARASLAAEVAARKLDRATWETASQKARADDLTHAAEVRARDDSIAQEKQRDLETKLADARAAADAYAARLRTQGGAAQGGSGSAHLPPAAGAPAAPAPAGEAAELDDLRTCAANTVIAEGWQSWWAKVSAAPR